MRLVYSLCIYTASYVSRSYTHTYIRTCTYMIVHTYIVYLYIIMATRTMHCLSVASYPQGVSKVNHKKTWHGQGRFCWPPWYQPEGRFCWPPWHQPEGRFCWPPWYQPEGRFCWPPWHQPEGRFCWPPWYQPEGRFC